MLPIVFVTLWLSWKLAVPIEAALFGGDLKQWLYATLGVNYDQRNSIIIAIALGFAVIPIIFTIAEDALSNVPRNLSAASLALGASRWQTAWRVVLPSALPGVFSAIMIGFGRAVGETMIVLMATGNTPIMSWSLFNGLRSLSANIAVEIPEAPLFGTLYRTLFLSAVLLFMLTFVINTAAELLRQRFRKKYGRY
jgi:phosphate transport system permease protein